MQEIYEIISQELMTKFGDKSKVDSMLEKLGELVIMDVLMEVMEKANKDQQEILKVPLQEGETGKFLEEAKALGLPVEKIYEKVCKKVVAEIFV